MAIDYVTAQQRIRQAARGSKRDLGMVMTSLLNGVVSLEGGGGPAWVPWTPNEIDASQQSLWLDPAHPLNVRAESGLVTALASTFPNGVFADTATSANRPAYVASSLLGTGKPAIRPSGTQGLTLSSSVANLGISGFSSLNVSTGQVSLAYSATSTVSGYPTAEPMIVVVVVQQGSSTLHRCNGVQIGSTGSVQASGSAAFAFVAYGGGGRLMDTNLLFNRAAGDRPYGGDVGDFIILKSLPTADTIARIEGYLAAKYGLQSKLPVDHAYKTDAPVSNYGMRDYFKKELSTIPWYGSATFAGAFDDGVKTVIGNEGFGTQGIAGTRKMFLSQYHHATGVWQYVPLPAVGLEDDDHGVPAVHRDYQGYIWAFGGAHNSDIKAVSSKYPDFAGAPVLRASINGSYTYPHVITIGSGMGMFLRRWDATATKAAKWVLRKTDTLADGVATWATAEEVLVDFGTDSRAYASEGYMRGTDYHVLLTRADYDDTVRRHVYKIIYDTVTGTKWNAGRTVGTPAGTAIDLATMNASYRLVDMTDLYGNIPWSVVSEDGNTTHILWMESTVSDGQSGGNGSIPASDQPLFYATVDASGVVSNRQQLAITTHRYNASCMTQNSDGTIDMWYVVGGTVDEPRGGKLYRRKRATNGTWGPATLIPTSNDVALDRPTHILNGRDSMKMVFCEVAQDSPDSFARPNKLFAHGSNGFVGNVVA